MMNPPRSKHPPLKAAHLSAACRILLSPVSSQVSVVALRTAFDPHDSSAPGGGGISRLSFLSAADGTPISVPAAQAPRVLVRLPTGGAEAAVCGYWDAQSGAYRCASLSL